MDNKDFTTLEVWRKSHQLMLDVYSLCKTLPKEEQFITIDQLKRSSSSVPANISEGYGRYYYQDNIAFCRKVRGSLYETRNHLIKCRDLNLCDSKECERLIIERTNISQLLNGYIRHLNKIKPGKSND